MNWLLMCDAAVSRLVTSNTGGAKYMPLTWNMKGLFLKGILRIASQQCT